MSRRKKLKQRKIKIKKTLQIKAHKINNLMAKKKKRKKKKQCKTKMIQPKNC